MSSALICDRCGFVRKDGENTIFGRITLTQTRGKVYMEMFNNKEFDLCANCMYRLEEFMKKKVVSE